MGIDKETEPSFLSITLTDNARFLKELRNLADSEGYNDDTEAVPVLMASSENANFEVGEYYYDENDNNIHFDGSLKYADKEVHLFFEVPLSDTIFIDILQESIKRLNKLKQAMELLKK